MSDDPRPYLTKALAEQNDDLSVASSPRMCGTDGCNRLALLGSAGCADHADPARRERFKSALDRIAARGR